MSACSALLCCKLGTLKESSGAAYCSRRFRAAMTAATAKPTQPLITAATGVPTISVAPFAIAPLSCYPDGNLTRLTGKMMSRINNAVPTTAPTIKPIQPFKGNPLSTLILTSQLMVEICSFALIWKISIPEVPRACSTTTEFTGCRKRSEERTEL